LSLVDVANGVESVLEVRRKNQQYTHDPVKWTEEYLGIKLWRAQREILESIRDNRNTAVAAGHGVGKSFVAGIAAAWWVDVHPHSETFVASTAPSVDQVAILWDNIRRVHSLAAQRFKDGIVDHPLPGYITGDNKWKLDDGTLLGQGRRPPEQKSDVAFQGRHADYLFAIGDEAVGLSAGFLNALGVIATGQWNRQLLIANPTDPGSAMAKIWDREDSNWIRMHISVMESPRIEPEEGFDPDVDAPGLSGWEFVDWAVEEYGGKDDPRYIARVLGQWAWDAGNTIFTAEDLTSARNTFVRPFSDSETETGWDIARMGSDATVGYILRRGEVWNTDPETGKPTESTGRVGLHIRRRNKWTKAPLVGTDPSNLGSANRIHDITVGDGTRIVKVDASGIGSGVIDGLNELNSGQYVVIEVFGGAASSDSRAYRNMRAEQFFLLKKDMAKGELDLDPEDTELFDELAGIQYELMDGGVIKVEGKDTIRKSGRKSPDHADGVWYARLDVSNVLGLDPVGTVKVQEYDELPDWGFHQHLVGAGRPML
jgi:hypothetical protein